MMRDISKDRRLEAGQSKRIWEELYKVIDSSDVLVEVLDARDPMGTRCRHVEEHLKKTCPNKHLILILNKSDLIPTSILVFMIFLIILSLYVRKNGKDIYLKNTLQYAITLV